MRKAVIPAAGLGTRFLPASKSIPKEMIPVVDRPGIQYAVEEAVQGRPRPDPRRHQPRQSRRWRTISTGRSSSRSDSRQPARRRTRRGPPDRRRWRTSSTSARRNRSGSVMRSAWRRAFCEGESFAVLVPDEIVPEPGRGKDESAPSTWCEIHDERSASVIAVQEVPMEDISSYGSIEPETVDDRPPPHQGHGREARGRGRSVQPRGARSLRVHFGTLRRSRSNDRRRGRRDPADRRDQPPGPRARGLRVTCTGADAGCR